MPKEKLQPVYDKGLALWLEHVLHAQGIKAAALDEVLSCISRYGHGSRLGTQAVVAAGSGRARTWIGRFSGSLRRCTARSASR